MIEIDDPKEITKILQQALNVALESAKNNAQLLFKKACEQVYYEFKNKYELCILKNEKDESKNIEKVVSSQIEFFDFPNGTVASITAEDSEEGIILFAQSHGTGISVNEKILEIYGVQDEVIPVDTKGGKVDLSVWYFDPTNEQILMAEKIIQIFGSRASFK